MANRSSIHDKFHRKSVGKQRIKWPEMAINGPKAVENRRESGGKSRDRTEVDDVCFVDGNAVCDEDTLLGRAVRLKGLVLGWQDASDLSSEILREHTRKTGLLVVCVLVR